MNSFQKNRLTPRIKNALQIRKKVERGIRLFFDQRGFEEVRTPLLVPSPGIETHIRTLKVVPHAPSSFKVHSDVFLPTSPEFTMKKLLAAGEEKIFQMAPVFRDEPCSKTHHPEFLMLEWYRQNENHHKIMADLDALVITLCHSIHGNTHLPFGQNQMNLKSPWPRLRIPDLFMEHFGIDLSASTAKEELKKACEKNDWNQGDLENESFDDLFFRVWLNGIENKISAHGPCFVTDYPPSQAALSRIRTDPDGTKWAERFECFIGGIELANGFYELQGSDENLARYRQSMELRNQNYGASFPPQPMDPEFLEALDSGFPESAGVALGVDRLVMLMANESDIRNTLWWPSYWKIT